MRLAHLRLARVLCPVQRPEHGGKTRDLTLGQQNECCNVEFTNWTTNRGDSYESRA